MKTAEHIVIGFPPYGGSPIIPVLRASNTFTKFRDFLPITHYISQTIQDIAMITMEGE